MSLGGASENVPNPLECKERRLLPWRIREIAPHRLVRRGCRRRSGCDRLQHDLPAGDDDPLFPLRRGQRPRLRPPEGAQRPHRRRRERPDGNLLAAIVNDTDDAHTLTIAFNGNTETVSVDPRSIVSLGTEDERPLLLSGLDSKPGTDLPSLSSPVRVLAVEFAVPILDGALPYYAEFVPRGGS